jgi:hypothetical protein
MRFVCSKECSGEIPPHTPEEQARPYAERMTAFSDTGFRLPLFPNQAGIMVFSFLPVRFD